MQHPEAPFETAYLDAATVNALAGKPSDPFWQQAYTSLIWKVRTAVRLASGKEGDLHRVLEVARDPDRLEALIDHVRETGTTDRQAETGRDTHAVIHWYHCDWNELDARLQRSLLDGLAAVAAMDVTVDPATGSGKASPVRLARRTGPWREWNPDSLPANARDAIERARRELYGPHRTRRPAGRRKRPAPSIGGPTTAGPLARRIARLAEAVDTTRECIRQGWKAKAMLATEKAHRRIRKQRPTGQEQKLAGMARWQATRLLRLTIRIADSVDLLDDRERKGLEGALQRIKNRFDQETATERHKQEKAEGTRRC